MAGWCIIHWLIQVGGHGRGSWVDYVMAGGHGSTTSWPGVMGRLRHGRGSWVDYVMAGGHGSTTCRYIVPPICKCSILPGCLRLLEGRVYWY